MTLVNLSKEDKMKKLSLNKKNKKAKQWIWTL